MEPKAIDFEMNDVSFDYVIDIKFVREVSYRRRRVYGMPLTTLWLDKPLESRQYLCESGSLHLFS